VAESPVAHVADFCRISHLGAPLAIFSPILSIGEGPRKGDKGGSSPLSAAGARPEVEADMSSPGRLAIRAAIVLATASALSFVGVETAGATTLGNVAGYSAPPSGGPTQSATVIFGVPTVNCTAVHKKGFQAVLAGVRLDASGGNTGGGVALVCAGKGAVYQAFIQLNGTSVTTTVTVSPGDTFTASASESTAATSVTITDGLQSQISTGGGATITGENVGDLSVNCDSSGCSPVPEIGGKTQFGTASINGLNLQAAGAVRENLGDAASQVQIKSSALKSSNTAFNTTWVLSCSLGAGVC
jgi:hypothetical protein